MSKDETAHHLADMIRSLDTIEFEKSPDGNVYVWDNPKDEPGGGLIKYSLRVGVHFGTVKKAIMASNLYVRIARVTDYDTYKDWLPKLDPANPDLCLYNGGWNPWNFLNAQMQMAQGQYQAYQNQNLWPYGPYGHNMTTAGIVQYPTNTFIPTTTTVSLPTIATTGQQYTVTANGLGGWHQGLAQQAPTTASSTALAVASQQSTTIPPWYKRYKPW